MPRATCIGVFWHAVIGTKDMPEEAHAKIISNYTASPAHEPSVAFVPYGHLVQGHQA